MVTYITLGLVVVAGVAYLAFRRPQPRFVNDMLAKSEKERALVLLQATVWRLKWEKDNPQFAGIYLDPWSFPPDICETLFSNLLNISKALADKLQADNIRLSEFGSPDKVTDDTRNACRTWGVTIGARLGKAKLEDIIRLWTAMRPSEASLSDALKELKERAEVHEAMGRPGAFLEGISIRQIVEEAHRSPNLRRQVH